MNDVTIPAMEVASVRKAYRARWNECNRTLMRIRVLMADVNCDHIDGVIIDDLRSLVWDITQCIHEFNAYRNAYGTITGRRVKAHSSGDLQLQTSPSQEGDDAQPEGGIKEVSRSV